MENRTAIQEIDLYDWVMISEGKKEEVKFLAQMTGQLVTQFMEIRNNRGELGLWEESKKWKMVMMSSDGSCGTLSREFQQSIEVRAGGSRFGIYRHVDGSYRWQLTVGR